jgi:hypothetical protein
MGFMIWAFSGIAPETFNNAARTVFGRTGNAQRPDEATPLPSSVGVIGGRTYTCTLRDNKTYVCKL